MTTTAVNLFSDCAALLFAPDRYDRSIMAELTRHLGFGHALDYTELNAVPDKVQPFYLVHGSVPDHNKLRLVRGLRVTDDMRRRYAPIVCVLAHGPHHQMVPLVEMGFDEVVFLSDPMPVIRAKLAGQLDHELTYIDAPNYFGPDRRRLERISRGDPRRIPGGTGHRRIRVVRDAHGEISATYLT